MEHDRNNQEEPTLDVSLDVESNFDEMLSALRVGVQKPSADRDAYNEDSIKCSSDSPQTDLDAYVAPNSEGCDPYLQTPPGGLDAEHGQVVTTNGYENCAIERENSALEDRKSLDSSAEDFEDEVVHHDIQETNCNDDQPVAPPTEETEVTTQAEEIQHTLEDDGESEVKSPTAIHDAETSEELVHDAHAVDEGWAKDDYPTIRRYSGATVDEDDYEVPKTQLSEELASLTVSADAKEDESACNAMNGFPPETNDAPAEVSDKEEENACHTTDDWSPAAHEAAAESDAPNEEVDVGCCAKCGDRVRMSEEVGAKGKTFHKECFRCIKCSCPLIRIDLYPITAFYHKPSFAVTPIVIDVVGLQLELRIVRSLRWDSLNTVRHSDAVVNEDELPEPEYTKSMIAKFQQPQQSSPPSQNAMNTPKVGKVKTPDFLNNNEKPSPEPSAPIDDVLPPTGSAKRLVEQWSTIVSQEKPQPADEHYYPPNTAKMIAAKFSAGLFNEDTESRAGDRSSPKVTRNGHTGECMGNGDQMDPELPAEGMTRDLIAKFSVREA
ncbi:unnamed protein product [Schistocephalus solidus]|uniref:LIM zinc-binding domain-containing protein n=1 Tax=Schistocephalus solidus TaxID=70667 RepID=A0A183SN83_SCHSO|nr:unnamed protein product [Schistocephalus solidus]